MASSRKLSEEEVNALITGLEAEDGPARLHRAGEEVRDFVFGSDDLSLLGDYYALRVINERFSRLARSVFQPMLRVQPRISPFPPRVQTFDEYVATVDSFMSLTTSRIDELRGSQMIVLNPDFISTLTNAYYGGSLRLRTQKRNDFTATETRVIEIVTNGLNRNLQAAWYDLVPLTFSDTAREENVQFASFVDGGDTVIVCSFVVQLPEIEPATFDILYPLQTLKPIAAQLRSRMQSDVIDDDLSWRERLENAVLSVPLRFSAELARPTVPLGRLMALKSGDVHPIQIGEALRVHVQDKPVYLADIGDVGGTRAITVTRRLE